MPVQIVNSVGLKSMSIILLRMVPLFSMNIDAMTSFLVNIVGVNNASYE